MSSSLAIIDDRGHRAHLIAATWYCYNCDFETVLSILRESIPKYNEAHGIVNSETSGYHETVTVFWATIVYKTVKGDTPFCSFIEAAKTVLCKYAHKNRLFNEFYSFDILSSKEARVCWIPPDEKGSL